MSDSLEEQMKDIFINEKLATDPSFYLFSPSLIDPSLAPEGKSVAYMLVPVPDSTDISKEEYANYADKILGELKSRLDPQLEEKIEWMDIRTPHESKQEGLFEGGSFGIAPTLFQSGVFRPQVKPFSMENIYAVGASVHPGGGIPIVMQGAKLLAEYIDAENFAKESSQEL